MEIEQSKLDKSFKDYTSKYQHALIKMLILSGLVISKSLQTFFTYNDNVEGFLFLTIALFLIFIFLPAIKQYYKIYKDYKNENISTATETIRSIRIDLEAKKHLASRTDPDYMCLIKCQSGNKYKSMITSLGISNWADIEGQENFYNRTAIITYFGKTKIIIDIEIL